MKDNSQENALIIIPAAGYGTRMGTPTAKELLLHPHTGRPLIENILLWAKNHAFPVLVVTRTDKRELIDYLATHFPQVIIQQIEPSKEWSDTVLQSKPYWAQKNILVLPDTEWNPKEICLQMDIALQNHELVVATHEVANLKTWGAVRSKDALVEFCEKPNENIKGIAWGLIGFQEKIGEELFQKLLESSHDHRYKSMNCTYKNLSLTKFNDLCR